MKSLLRLLSSVYRRHPLSTSQQEAQRQPFFIIGSGRSGTTLLRSLLYRHPRVHIPPETDFALPQAIRIFQNYQWLPWPVLVHLILAYFQFNDAFRYWELNLGNVKDELINLPASERSLWTIIDRIYRAHGTKEGKKDIWWGDKTPLITFGLKELHQLYPDAKYIEMVRDPRAVVNSYLRFGRYDKLKDACGRWQQSIEAVEGFRTKIGSQQVMQIRYEDLVEKPEAYLKELCSFLQLNFDPGMLVHEAQSMGDTILQHHANVHQPITVQHREKWKTELSSEQIIQIETQLGERLRQQGYTNSKPTE